MRVDTIPLLLCFSGAMALAQYPGQYPPGQYPPGRYPPGTCPPGQYCGNQQPNSIPGGRSKSSKKDKNSNSAVTTTTIGMVRRSVANQIVIEPDDHRIIWYRVTSTTKFMKDNKEVDAAAFAPGDRVTLDSTGDDEDMFTAVEMRFDKAGAPEDRAHAREDWDLPPLAGGAVGKGTNSASSPQREPGDDRPVLRRANSGQDSPQQDAPQKEAAPKEVAKAAPTQAAPAEPEDTRPATTMKLPDPPKDPDDPGPPSLRRGVPTGRQMADLPPPRFEPLPEKASAKAAPEDAPRQTASAPTTLSGRPVDPVIEKAREAAANYLSSLPNYFCQQMTARYQSDHPKTGWDALDVVTADVMYEDGKESYKNVKLGSKSVKSIEDIGGTRSTGEFSTILEDLLSPYTDANFRKSGSDTLSGRPAWMYKYDIPRERSHWRIEAPSQLYYPAHSGTVWIDKETSRVLRIEQGTTNMPKLFPFDTVETVTDYAFISLAAGAKYLLPADAEVLSCLRGTSMCTRNRLEFRNYRKFGAESSITFDGKQ